MNYRTMAINSVLAIAILASSYELAVYVPTRPEARDEAARHGNRGDTPEAKARFESLDLATRYTTIQEGGIFDTIIPPPPPPRPTIPPTPTPPLISVMMGQYSLITMDPPQSVTLQHKTTTDLLEWKVRERRLVKLQNLELPVTLKSVDGNEFRAVFTAPFTQTFTVSFFGEAPK